MNEIIMCFYCMLAGMSREEEQTGSRSNNAASDYVYLNQVIRWREESFSRKTVEVFPF